MDECINRVRFLMNIALFHAELAYDDQSMPICAMIVRFDEIISVSLNSKQNGMFHAELDCILDATRKLGQKYLQDCEIFVTHQPCEMCCNALALSRVKCIFFASYDKCFFVNIKHIKLEKKLSQYYQGIFAERAEFLLKTFFSKRRKNIC